MFLQYLNHRRTYLLAAACLVLLAAVPCLAADEQPKLYSPFDEKAPKMPTEFAEDERLDIRLDVSVKNKNFRDLFTEIRRVTGVNLVASREIAAERAIIFFRDRPLRDLMTELSGLFGYYWLARGQKGQWTYELFEDVVHAKQREQVRDAREGAQTDALMEAADIVTEAMKSPAAMERLRQENPRLYETASNPSKQEMLKLINVLGKETVRGCINDVGTAWDFAEMSQELQGGVLSAINTQVASWGDESFQPYTAEELRKSSVRVKRWRQSIFTPPHVVLVITMPGRDGKPGWRSFQEWPGYKEGEPDMLSMPEAPPPSVTGDPLPVAEITAQTDRKVLYWGTMMMGHVLEAIAEQADLDIIADYYFQQVFLEECDKEPLEKLVHSLCTQMGYSCQVENDLLRFRCNKWYLQPLPEEPPMSIQEHWWRRIFETGALSLDDLLDIACLRDRQTYWGGFRFIPGAFQARLFPRTARMVRMLGPSLEEQACGPQGVPVSQLDADQFGRIADWANVMSVKETPEGLRRCTIRLKKKGDPVNSVDFILELPDGTPRNVTLTARVEPLSRDDRRILAAERAAELAADSVALSATGE